MAIKLVKLDEPVHKALKLASVEAELSMSKMIARLLELKNSQKPINNPRKQAEGVMSSG